MQDLLSSPILSHSLSLFLILACYLVATVTGLTALSARMPRLLLSSCVLALFAFLFQTMTLILGYHKTFGDGLSGGAYLQLFAWFIMLAAVLLWFKLRKPAAMALSSPLCAALFAMSIPYMQQSIRLPDSLNYSFYMLHMGTLFAALALMAVACLVSMLFLILERSIKRKERVKGFLEDIPALSALDTVNGFCILASFPLYTVGILTGILSAKPVFGTSFSGDPKEIVSILIWLVLAFIFHSRIARAWSGKKPAIAMICVFLLSLFSLFVVNTLMQSHHTFH
ncbi:MAG: cytochrome c biogenesis protein [Desulfovibrio sp.]|nr:cytochrome c biogenesis protein [Desulfovibrio sp.]